MIIASIMYYVVPYGYGLNTLIMHSVKCRTWVGKSS